MQDSEVLESLISYNHDAYIFSQVIGTELLRNCLISLACVLVVTLILIASPLTCFFVVICVLFTLVDVGKFRMSSYS